MKGGVILFRGAGTAARRYLEADRSQADDYYLEAGTALAQFTITDSTGQVVDQAQLSPEQYAGWVDWTHPLTGEQMGTPRLPGDGRQGSPRFAEMVVNTPKSLSIAAALHPEVSAALDAAQQDAVAEIRRWLAQHSVTRVGPRGAQEVVPVEQLQTVGVAHRTSRAGDPHRHIHFQIGTRVQAAGKWRALDTAALFKQQGAIRALGTAVLAAHPGLAETLDRHGLSLDPVTGEVAELERFNSVMSKRARQVERNLGRMEADWEAAHPGEEPGPVVRSRMLAKAWAHERPHKMPGSLNDEAGWRAELTDAGYEAAALPRPAITAPRSLDDLSVQEMANRALDRCAAGASTWTRHTIQEHVTRITTEHGVRATGEELREFITITTRLAAEDCFSVLPPGAVQPDHVAHLTSVRVVQAETQLRDLLHARVREYEPEQPDVTELAAAHGLDEGQTVAAAAVASTDPLVVVEGAAGAGKTTMLGAAITAAERQGRRTRVVTPTKKAADVAHHELGVPTDSVAGLVHAHGFRWNADGVWTRLTEGNIDPDTGQRYHGPAETARLTHGERVIVDEAGMLDQDTALALLTITAESGGAVALVGDRAQLPAVGRGGVLEMAAHIRGRTIDMTDVHRFTDPAYADLTVRMRTGTNPAALFDQLHQFGLIRLHTDDDTVREHIAAIADENDAITVATNDEATTLNDRIRAERVERGDVDDGRTVTGSDDLSIGVGDVIQTRKNDAHLRVANRQTWTVQHIGDDGTVWAKETGTGRKHQHTVALPAAYVEEHAHLAYAATAYGVQGATTEESHTVLTGALDVAALYVGMTRGRHHNVLHIVAENIADAREQFTTAMERDRADRGLTDATVHAREATRGLIEDGPVKLVNTELARLANEAKRADDAAATWERIAEHLDAQTTTHRAEADEAAAALQIAQEQAATVRAQVTETLTVQAMADGRDYLQARAEETHAAALAHRDGWFALHRAERDHDTAQQNTETVRGRLRTTWGTVPDNADVLTDWAAHAAAYRLADHPHPAQTDRAVADAKIARRRVTERHRRERLSLLTRLYGPDKVRRDPARYERANPHREAAKWHAIADQTRVEAAQLRTLPLDAAARRVLARRAPDDAARPAATEHARRLGTPNAPAIAENYPRRDGPALGL